MNKSLLVGTVLGAVGATAGGVIAGYNYYKEPEYAEVLQVTEAFDTRKVPREVCEDVAVTRKRPVKDQHQVAGTVVGAVVGGLLGNQVGGGSGKKVATVAGAVAGGYAGNKVQENMQSNDVYTTTERRCRTVQEEQKTPAGFDVRYRLNGEERTVRMEHSPGERIPVKDGQLVLAAAPQQ